jgi:hypothetical protein
MRVAAGVGFGGGNTCVLALRVFLTAGVILLFFLEKQVRRFKVLILGDLINALTIALAEYLIEFSFGNNTGKNLEVIHKFGELREGNLIFRLGVKVKNSFKWVCNCFEHFHALAHLLLVIGKGLICVGVEILRAQGLGVGDDQVVDLVLGDVQLFGCLVHQFNELDEFDFAAG